jgi:hypothetical protein
LSTTLGEGGVVSQKAVTALVFLIAVFLGIVILVGLAQRELDVTGVAVALSGVISGIVAGGLLRGRSNPDKGGDGE